MAYINLHKKNLYHNLDTLSKKAGGVDRIFAVLKDNAYGHGLEVFGQEIAKYGVIRAIVRDIDEALKIKNLFKEVLVLSEKSANIKPISGCIFAVNSLQSLKSIPKNTTVALKIDTGMHRNGICLDEFDAACKEMKEKSLNLHSIFTHFRAADEIGGEFFWQKQNFSHVKIKYNELKHKYNLQDTQFHSCNSAALLRTKAFDEDFARVGIAMYGYNTLPNAFEKLPLKPVLELFAEKMSQRELKTDEKVGYGGVYKAKKDHVSSFYDVGYGDGLFRYSKNGNLTTTNGSKILGRTSMDGMSIESELENISIFHDVSTWAKHFETIPYDILVKLSPKIIRKFI